MPQKQKLSPDEKIKIVRQCLSDGIGGGEAARQVSVTPTTVQYWIDQYVSEGVGGLLTNERNRTYSAELKEQAVCDYLSNAGSLQDICKKYRIRSNKQLREWIKVYNVRGDFNSVKHSGGGSYMMQGRETTQEERIQIVNDCLASGKNYGETAVKYC